MKLSQIIINIVFAGVITTLAFIYGSVEAITLATLWDIMTIILIGYYYYDKKNKK